MKHTMGSSDDRRYRPLTTTSSQRNRREGGECLFTADLSWAREEAPIEPPHGSLNLRRVAMAALLALAVVGIVMMNGPADAGPVRRAESALPAPVSEAEPAAVDAARTAQISPVAF